MRHLETDNGGSEGGQMNHMEPQENQTVCLADGPLDNNFTGEDHSYCQSLQSRTETLWHSPMPSKLFPVLI